VYELKPEYAGRLLECPVCRRRLRAGAASGPAWPSADEADPAFDRNVFHWNHFGLLRTKRPLVRDRRIGFVLAIWAAYSILGRILTPYIDNGAHLGGALGGAITARLLHPAVLEPMPPEHAATVRKTLWFCGAVLAYAAVGWVARTTR
jgi:hypothetical protein